MIFFKINYGKRKELSINLIAQRKIDEVSHVTKEEIPFSAVLR